MNSTSVVVISENPLFMEVVEGFLVTQPGLVASHSTPTDLQEVIKDRPNVMLVDDLLPPEILSEVLAQTRQLPRIRVLMMNIERNDFVALDSRRIAVRKIDDLLHAIVEGQQMTSKDNHANGFESHWENAEARAGVYSFLVGFCNQRPDEDLVRRLRAIEVTSLLSTELDGPVSEGLGEIAGYLEQTQDQDEEDVALQLAVDWTRLFRGVKKDYGPPPPYEAVYLDQADEVRVLKAVIKAYEASKAYVHKDVKERPDYIGVELDFLRYLADREAEAWRQSDREGALKENEAAEEFLNDHLGRWLSRFCDRALEESKTDFYQGVIRIMRAVLDPEIELATVKEVE